jgi:cob(I)alamin adenosyltransferase
MLIYTEDINFKMASQIKKSSIYTRTGDKGQTSLYNGQRRTKADIIFEAVGTVDELTVAIGKCYLHIDDWIIDIKEMLIAIQGRLMDIGSSLATPRDTTSSASKLKRVQFPSTALEILEKEIDRLDSKLPTLKNFILPSGCALACELHTCRIICRRTERLVVAIYNENPDSIEEPIMSYLNRLSDYFFVAARYANHVAGEEEIIYRKA